MNPLQHRLDSLRRRVILSTFWRGTWGVLALVLGGVLLACLLDKALPLPSVLRAFLLLGIIGSACFVAFRFLIYPLARRSDNLSLALRVEEVYPELNDILASSVQFLEVPDDELPGSKVLRQRAVEQAQKRAENCNFNLILDRRGAFALIFALPMAAMLFGFASLWLFWNFNHLSWTAALRLADPFGDHTWTQLNVAKCPDRIAKGQPYVIKASLAGIPVHNARLELESQVKTEKPIPVKWDAERQTGAFVLPIDMTQQTGKFRFRIAANDATYPRRGAWHDVQVLPPPMLVELNGKPSPQLELHYPAYTQLPSPQKLSAGQGHVDAVAGTKVVWKAVVDQPVDKAWLELQPENSAVKAIAQLPPMGHADPWSVLSLSLLGQSIGSRVPVQIDETGKLLSVEFTPWLSGSYWIQFRKDDLAGDYKNELRIFPDPVPVVQVKSPAGSQSLLADAQLTFQLVIEDEVFGIRSVYVEYRRKNAVGGYIDATPQVLPIWDPRPDERPRRLELTKSWDLRGIVKEGDSVELQVCADDYNDLFTPRAVGRSAVINLRIVSKTDLAKELDHEFGKIQQALAAVKIQQEKANENVKEVESKKTPSKADQEKLVESQQLQREIQERVEELQKELAKLKQKMDDNKLPPSNLQDLVRTLTTELARLQREDFSQIEPKLAEARKDLADPQKKDKKDQPAKEKSSLEQAKAMQEDAIKSLAELSKFLDPWASLQQIQAETRKLIAQQKDIKKDTEELETKKNPLPEKERQAEIAKKGEAQNALAKKAQDLVGMMKEAMEKQKGSETAKKLADAIKIADSKDLPDTMRQASEMIKKPQLNEAAQKQAEILDNLKKVQAALEKNKREEELDTLKKKQKQAEKDVQQLTQKMNDLHKKMKDANNIADPEKRAAELKKLAKEEEKLREEIQEEARELARLRAEKPSRDLSKAANELAEAGKKMQAGENGEQEMQQAEQKMKQAQQDLDEAEEELAREQLALIADQIKGLKDRQDAALAESERIHKELERKKQWSQGLLGSLKESGNTQSSLAQEAESLREKLKDAKVFEHILMKAGKSMDQAAEAIKKRAEDKAFDPLEEEELAGEKKDQANIVKNQKEAAGRLQRLLDALKNDPALAQKNPMEDKPGPEKPDQKKPEEQNGGMKLRGGDGIPPNAQIKALRDEQIDVRQHTKEFDERFPDRSKLTPEQENELRELEQDQTRIQQLFNGLLSKNNEKEGDEP